MVAAKQRAGTESTTAAAHRAAADAASTEPSPSASTEPSPAASTEASPSGSPAARLGPRLRALRKARDLTIAELAEAAGLTKGFVSRLERDQSSVSIAALLRICDVVQTPIGALFEAPSTALVRDTEGPVIDFGNGMRHRVQTPADVSDVRVVTVECAPGASAGKEAYALHGGTEFVRILKGSLEIQLEGDCFQLEVGDCLTFPGRALHTYRNLSRRERCEALWVIAPSP